MVLAGAAAVVAVGLAIGLRDGGDAEALRAPNPTGAAALSPAEAPSVAATPHPRPAAVTPPVKHHGAHKTKHHKPKHHGAKPHKPKHHKSRKH